MFCNWRLLKAASFQGLNNGSYWGLEDEGNERTETRRLFVFRCRTG